MAWMRHSLLGLMIGACAACGDDAGDEAAGTQASSSTGTGDVVCGAPAEADDPEVPTTPDALHEWLRAGSYLAFPAESGPHPSAGPHGGDVRTFLAPRLADSLATGAPQHPAGAAAVKELYGQSTTVTGWAVSVKTGECSDGGDGIYWYEVFDTAPGTQPGFAGAGLALCTNCHDAGRDFVLTPWPLQ